MIPGQRRPLDYAPPEERRLPTWAHGVAIVFWVLMFLLIYGSAISAPIMLAISIFCVTHSTDGIHAFGEPIITPWQKTRFVLWPALMTAIFIPLAIWLHKQRDRNS